MIHATSIRLRITLYLIVAIVLTLGTATIVIDSNVDHEVAQRADANLLQQAQALADIFSTEMKAKLLPFQSHQMPSFLAENSLVYYVINCRDQHILSSQEAASLPWHAPQDGPPHFSSMVNSKGLKLRAVAFRFSAESGVQTDSWTSTDHKTARSPAYVSPDCDLGLAVGRHEVRHFQEYMDNIEIGCVVLGLLAVVILVPLLVTRGLRPLSQLAEAMQEIGPDAPEKRLDGASAAELKPLVARFNEVLLRMEEGLLRERQFASGIAHELRTPLAELRTAIEVELRYPSGRNLRMLLSDIRDIGMEMERMVVALLLLTRIEAGIEKLEVQPVDVTALTQRLLDRHQRSIQARKLTLQTELQPAIWLADIALLDVVLSNLLGNAIAYAPTGSDIALQCGPHRWYVKNVAPGIDERDVELMGQRFWRKGKDAGVHTGLGLALATAAARVQAVRLDLSLENGYLLASVSLTSMSQK